jgi:anti-sigma factor RsiW
MRWFGRLRRRRTLEVPGLACREVVELVTDYIEGALPPDEAARVETHLAACDGCTTYVEQIRETIRLAGRVSEEQISAEAREALVNAFRSWRSA